VPRWNPSRWSLGASALVAVVVAGCGASSTHSNPSLHAGAEKRLLSLVARARTDATRHDGTAVDAVMGDFVSEVQTLKSSGQLTAGTAGSLAREARLTAAQASLQLRPAKSKGGTARATTQTSTAPASVTPATQTAPTTAPTTAADPAQTPATSQATTPASAGVQQQNDQGDGSDSPWPGHGYGRGYGRYGGGYAAWLSALRNWIYSNSNGAGGGD
jgi:hypothetical protein